MAFIGYFGFKENQHVQAATRSTPTFFFHGYGSSYRAEQNMTTAIRRAGVTNTIVRINVSRTGKTILIGRIPRGTKNPLVEVNFADNRLSGASGSYVNAYYTIGARYVRNAINAVTKRYGYRTINAVSHSMGNLEFINYIRRYHNAIATQ